MMDSAVSAASDSSSVGECPPPDKNFINTHIIYPYNQKALKVSIKDLLCVKPMMQNIPRGRKPKNLEPLKRIIIRTLVEDQQRWNDLWSNDEIRQEARSKTKLLKALDELVKEKIIVKITVSHKYRSYAISIESNNIEKIVHLESQAKHLVKALGNLDTQSTDSDLSSNYHTLRQGLVMLNLPILNYSCTQISQSTGENNFARGWVKDIALETFFESASILQEMNTLMIGRVLQEINSETLTESLKHSEPLYDITKYVTEFLTVTAHS